VSRWPRHNFPTFVLSRGHPRKDKRSSSENTFVQSRTTRRKISLHFNMETNAYEAAMRATLFRRSTVSASGTTRDAISARAKLLFLPIFTADAHAEYTRKRACTWPKVSNYDPRVPAGNAIAPGSARIPRASIDHTFILAWWDFFIFFFYFLFSPPSFFFFYQLVGHVPRASCETCRRNGTGTANRARGGSIGNYARIVRMLSPPFRPSCYYALLNAGIFSALFI